DRGRNDRGVRGNHRADGRTDAEMDIRHRGDVMMHDRQLRDVDELLARLRLDVASIDLDRDASLVNFLENGHQKSALLRLHRLRHRVPYAPAKLATIRVL